MRNLKLIVMTCALAATLSLAAAAQTQSLYERLGGKASISAVVDEFATRLLADTRVNKKFAKSDPVRLKAQLVDQLCAATGGPCQYGGRDMKTTHTNMGVTAGEFNALVEDLVGALDKFNVPAAEKNELLGALGPMKPQIVESEATATGTALPKKFVPYSAESSSGKAKGKGKKMKDEAKADKKMKEEKPKEEPAADTKEEKKSKKKAKGN